MSAEYTIETAAETKDANSFVHWDRSSVRCESDKEALTLAQSWLATALEHGFCLRVRIVRANRAAVRTPADLLRKSDLPSVGAAQA